ncbi:MAG: peptidoglycan DD-metalloendopeptidase family protein [Rudaea sp.]
MPFHLRYIFRFRLRIVGIAVALAIAGCASGPPAPVVELSTGGPAGSTSTTESGATRQGQAPDAYRVVAGDTLYSIAFRHGLDYRELARWNAIASPFRIGIGQLLRLHPIEIASKRQPVPGEAITEAVPDRSVAATVTALTVTTLPPPVRSPVTAAIETPAPPHQPPPPVSAPAPPVNAVVQAPPATTVVEQQPAPQPATQVAELNSGGVTWRWPSDGKVIGTYIDGDQTRQGLDIAGSPGDPVRAAAAGEVVYSGNGLIGYGELIIVKHNTSFLSAYGHNRKRLVKEGQHVNAGEQIAEMGSTASSRDELHFEIRKNGKPVNPLDYLPAR